MRAIVAHRLGEPEVLEIAKHPAPTAREGEVVVAVQVAGVNFAETERRRGVYRPPIFPWIPGGEGAGLVVSVGPHVDPAWQGRRVAFWALEPATSGSYAELCRAPVDSLFPLPDSLDFETAAALPLQGLTAYGLVHFGASIRAGQTVLVQAAGGGVGLLAVQLARLAGARVMGTASSESKRAAIARVGGEQPSVAEDDLGRCLCQQHRGRGGGERRAGPRESHAHARMLSVGRESTHELRRGHDLARRLVEHAVVEGLEPDTDALIDHVRLEFRGAPPPVLSCRAAEAARPAPATR